MAQTISFITAPCSIVFDCLCKLLLIAVTLPVIRASSERSFSKMKLVKPYLRNYINSQTFFNIDLRSIEIVRVQKIDVNAFIDKFDSRHDNRRIRLHWVDVDMKFWGRLCRNLCGNNIDHCLFAWIFFFGYLRYCVFPLWQDSHKDWFQTIRFRTRFYGESFIFVN